MGKTTIRHAIEDDVDLLMNAAVAMHAESPRFSKLAFSERKVLGLFLQLIRDPSGLMLVAEQNDTIVGGMAAVCSEHWFSDDRMATDLALFILPEHRGGMTAARLVRGYIEWAREQGAKIIQVGISTGVHTEETASLYRSLGLQQFGYGFEV